MKVAAGGEVVELEAKQAAGLARVVRVLASTAAELGMVGEGGASA